MFLFNVRDESWVPLKLTAEDDFAGLNTEESEKISCLIQ